MLLLAPDIVADV